MSDFFTPYEGKKPFVFISYAHKDSERVLPAAAALHQALYRVWYDEGIAPGSNWPANIARHLQAAACVLFFASEASLASPNCAREISFAQQKRIPILCVRLDDAPFSGAPWEALGNVPTLPVQTEANVENIRTLGLADTLRGDGQEGYGNTAEARAGINGWLVAMVFGALLFAATAAGMAGLLSGRFDDLLGLNQPAPALTPLSTVAPRTPAPTPAPVAAVEVDEGLMQSILDAATGKNIAFTCKQEERIVRRALGVDADARVRDDDLLSLTALHICGTTQLKSREGIEIGEDIRVNGAPVMQGEIETLTNFAQMRALTELTLCDQRLTDIAPLASLQRLDYLNLSCNAITRIPDLSNMASLTALDISHTAIRDITPLNALPNLRRVYVDASMFPLDTEPVTQRYDLVLVK